MTGVDPNIVHDDIYFAFCHKYNLKIEFLLSIILTVCGRFNDISAKSFFRVQLDLEYRKVWDKYVIQLDCVDKDPEEESEVIHWVTHFPVSLIVFSHQSIHICILIGLAIIPRYSPGEVLAWV